MLLDANGGIYLARLAGGPPVNLRFWFTWDALLMNYFLYTSFLNPSEPLDLCPLLTCATKTPEALYLISPTVRIYSWLDTFTDQRK